MKHRRGLVPVLIVALAVAACGGNPPPEPPAQDTSAEDEAARRRAEEERRAREEAERARREREAREERMAAAARARELLEERIHYDYDESSIRPDAEVILRGKVDVLRPNNGVRLMIEGHADERGSVEYNLALGMRRAESAKAFLTGFGMDGSRFQTTSFGEDRPLVNASNERAWAQNRRAEFRILAGADDLVMPDAQ